MLLPVQCISGEKNIYNFFFFFVTTAIGGRTITYGYTGQTPKTETRWRPGGHDVLRGADDARDEGALLVGRDRHHARRLKPLLDPVALLQVTDEHVLDPHVVTVDLLRNGEEIGPRQKLLILTVFSIFRKKNYVIFVSINFCINHKISRNFF